MLGRSSGSDGYSESRSSVTASCGFRGVFVSPLDILLEESQSAAKRLRLRETGFDTRRSPSVRDEDGGIAGPDKPPRSEVESGRWFARGG